ncbi:hypothetical protein M441DRAFT_332897 [Trichoderma asperellum CBS 433.97]|uniref:Uncharacterized protein n=1 Tax=Trichoderma asperellum (strain ATCC 204424 / CBS 433.97 / NBRC 101777) TaxID=1042311 RepID=A0A2T3YRS3_TRIA4|nr:hypothetical protein M441DRAFT_332897 [Trichoderma asperellum CBS 433.97]PTB35224.1 hypothetical protein M441DRAFT_332897 [Trichoderma asperellum CBS 433.97]
MPEEGKRRENTCHCCFSGGKREIYAAHSPELLPCLPFHVPDFGPILKNSQTMSLQKAPILYTDDSPRVGGREYLGCFSIDKVRQRLDQPLLEPLGTAERENETAVEEEIAAVEQFQQLKITFFQTALALLSMSIAIPRTAQRAYRVGRHRNNSTAASSIT